MCTMLYSFILLADLFQKEHRKYLEGDAAWWELHFSSGRGPATKPLLLSQVNQIIKSFLYLFIYLFCVIPFLREVIPLEFYMCQVHETHCWPFWQFFHWHFLAMLFFSSANSSLVLPAIQMTSWPITSSAWKCHHTASRTPTSSSELG